MKKNILISILLIMASFVLTGCEKNAEVKDNNASIETKFTLSYQNVNILPGTEFKKESLSEKPEYSEIESCAFQGVDKVYTYNDLEITTADMEGKEKVYSVYFLSDEIATTEGIKITDDKAKMIEKYGDAYDNIGNEYSYTKGNAGLYFIIENDIIISIEYKYVMES